MPCKPMTFQQKQRCDIRGGCICVYNDAKGIGRYIGQPCYWTPTRLKHPWEKPCTYAASPPAPTAGGKCGHRAAPWSPVYPVACNDPRCNVGPCAQPARPPSPTPSPAPPPPPGPGGGIGGGGGGGIGGGAGGGPPLQRVCGYGPNPCTFGRSNIPCPPSGPCPPRPGDRGIRMCC